MVPVVAARRLTGGMPEYSSALRQRRVGGIVEVLIRIDLNGRVVSAIAVSGPPPLREAAEAAVLKWRYAPGTRNGIPIETESKVRFSFDPSQSRRP
jgi:protein TonB